MSELLKTYEKDFSKHFAGANKKLSSVTTTPNPEQLIREAKQDVSEAERWLNQMEMELRNLQPNIASQFQAKIARHRESLAKVKQSLIVEEQRKAKVDLMGKEGSDARDKLLSANEALQASGETLERTLKVGAETEQIGNDTLNTLKAQRRQIQGIGEKVEDVGTNLNSANRVITTMDRRRLWMKIIMYIVILMLIIAIAALLFVKLG
jgi:DNA repair exonuclease SbcCD ATPase subunit